MYICIHVYIHIYIYIYIYCDVAVPTDVYPTRFVVGRVPNGHAGRGACERTDREISGEAKNINFGAIC